MNGGNKIIGLRRQSEADEAQPAVTDDELLLEEYYSSEFSDQPVSAGWPAVARVVLAASAAIWTIFTLWVMFGRGQPLPPVEAIPGAVATFAIPLVLIGTLYLLLIRNSHAESRRFQKAAESLRLESEALEQKLSRIGTQLANAKAAMQEQALLLENYGAAASANMEASAKLIASSAAEAADHTMTAEKAGAELAGQMTELVRTLPSLQERANSMSAHLMESSQAMTGRIDSLERRLQAVMAISDDARLRTLSATKSLTTQLAQLQEETRSASDEINGMAEQAAQRIDAAITGARAALEETGMGLEAQATSLNALVEQSRTAITGIGGEAVTGFQGHSQSIEARLLELSRILEGHQQISAGLSDDLTGKLDFVESRFGEFEKQGLARNERIASTLATVAAEAERMDRALAAGNSTAEQLISRSESLLMALDSSVREIEETYPAALGRLDGRVEETRKLLASAEPEIEKLETIAQSVLGRTQETEELLRDQAKRLNELLETTGENLASNRSEVEMLRDVLYSADEGAARLKESAGPQLVAALVRVKDTADQAAERARQSLARAIPDAADALGKASADALKNAVSEQVTAQIAQLSSVADQAIDAVSAATDRLDRKIQAMSESSNSIEQKILQADEAVAARDRDHYTRRSKDLIESLNSTAIDITKVLSSDVTDLDWADYLKGDRGVFTRRAVRLLDAGEAREIGLQYDGNAEFQEHVNRYIHDFEGMLRIILGARDGNALAVTLLSSDMGKLYVALAQAIDRLR
ncbi:hypothetical protein [Sphingobium phenoxybenzoativorans]|uniref:hypothetical protein n=1 Tax=Sphingobium phenoxybenzoativorans TaxID=1592790 RepID=UPI00087272BF|nr:hypothetical protein [Sphingobium phenoxybenzoativorans]